MAKATNDGRLAGKVALITGGAGNIGEVMTRRFLAAGATVAISGRNAEKLAAYRQRLLDEGFEAERLVTVRMDGSNLDEVRAGVAELMQRLGRIDVLVNNAGSAGPRRPLAAIPLNDDELQAPDTETLPQAIGNLLGLSWHTARAVAPHMSPGGSIINVSTIFSRTDYYGRIPYVVPKAALNALSQAMAQELGAQGIRVNTIYPGPIDSERIRTVFKAMDGLKGEPEGTTAQGFFDIMRLSRADNDGTLQKGFPKTWDVAGTAVFLASDEAAGLSGHALEVTNGMIVPPESTTTLVSRPELRTADATGRVVLVAAGDQVEEALALTGLLRSLGAQVALGFRDRRAIAQIEQALRETHHLQGASYTPPLLLALDPLVPGSVATALNQVREAFGTPQGVVVLPGRGGRRGATFAYDDAAIWELLTQEIDGEAVPTEQRDTASTVLGCSDEAVKQFLEQEVGGVVAFATQLARFWREHSPGRGARVIFLSNPDDGQGNTLSGILRTGIEQLVRVWRHEAARDASGPAEFWANQIVRYTNREDEGLDFSCAWAVRLLVGDRRIAAINLELPQHIAPTLGALRPTYGWAERLFGLHLGKVALITGGSAGIGGQIGRLLALAGARVVLAARGAAQLEQMRATILAELREAGYPDPEGRVVIVSDCDVADDASLARLAETTLATFGRVDYLINNAGIAGVEEMVIDTPLAGWRATLRANLVSNYTLARTLLPVLKQQGEGYILNVSSYFGGEKYVAIPYPNRADYAVSKAGQRALAEALARFVGPEVQINAIAPGPVDGDRLRGTGERPGLFSRRARLILENKRLNEIHAALVEAQRAGARIPSLLPALMANNVAALKTTQVPALQSLAAVIADQNVNGGLAGRFLMNEGICQKLVRRLRLGGELPDTGGEGLPPFNAPPTDEPFFAPELIKREAGRVRDGVLGMLYLRRMPTEFDVAMATVYYLADRNVSGETFHPSGGLKLDRTVTEGELFGKGSRERIAQLQGRTVFLVGEHLQTHLLRLSRAFLDDCGAARVVLVTETEGTGQVLLQGLGEHAEAGRVVCIAAGDDIEGALKQARARYGLPGPVVSMPFRPLPNCRLSADANGDWSDVLSAEGFADVVEHNLTHHFRVARTASLMQGAQLVLVTPETSARSSAEEFALANFIKTSLHALTATLGAESERTAHHVPVNQVDLTRRSRSEEPRGAGEEAEELERFVSAVLLTSAPIPAPHESRYRARIYRGNAITV